MDKEKSVLWGTHQLLTFCGDINHNHIVPPSEEKAMMWRIRMANLKISEWQYWQYWQQRVRLKDHGVTKGLQPRWYWQSNSWHGMYQRGKQNNRRTSLWIKLQPVLVYFMLTLNFWFLLYLVLPYIATFELNWGFRSLLDTWRILDQVNLAQGITRGTVFNVWIS